PGQGRGDVRGPAAPAAAPQGSEERVGPGQPAGLPGAGRRQPGGVRLEGRGAHQPGLVLQPEGQPGRHGRARHGDLPRARPDPRPGRARPHLDPPEGDRSRLRRVREEDLSPDPGDRPRTPRLSRASYPTTRTPSSMTTSASATGAPVPSNTIPPLSRVRISPPNRSPSRWQGKP